MKSLKNLFKRPQPAQADQDREDKKTTGARQADAPKVTLEQVEPSQLRRLLATQFDAEQLRALCFDLKVPYEDLGGQGRAGKALQLVLHLQRRMRLPELVDELARLRPEALQAAAAAPPRARPTPRRPDVPQKKRGPVDTPPTQTAPEPAHLTQLTRLLDRHFNLNELRDLCFELRVDYGSLPGAGAKDKARELVLYVAHRGRSTELVAACMGLRPDVAWEQALHATDDP